MNLPLVPVKTALGQEELRQRSPLLSQRHRTVLFIVDGRRPLSEVLGLAHQAGAATSHFEDLVRLGLVDLPRPPEPPPLPEPPPAPQLPEVAAGNVPTPPPDIAAAEPELDGESAPTPRTEPASPSPPRAAAEAPVRVPRVHLPEPEPSDEELVQQVRQLLLDTQRHDRVPPRSSIPAQLRAATTLAELIKLAWHIQNELDLTRRSRDGANCLQRARELLGLGNTLVSEDTRPGGVS